MEKEAHSQLELFSQTGDSISSLKTDSSLMSRIWGYERRILLIFGIIVISIISFTLGVEKGKKLVTVKSNAYFDVTLKPQAVKVKPAPISNSNNTMAPAGPIKQQETTIEKQGLINEQKIRDDIQTYTIQLASYKSANSAQKEAQNLKKSGLAPLVLTKGAYAVLCVGNFSNKQTAQTLLTQLKKRYRDCYIRRL